MIARFAGGPFHGEVREVPMPYIRYAEYSSRPWVADPDDALIEYEERMYLGEKLALPFDPTPLGFEGVEKHTDLATGKEWWTCWTLFTPEAKREADGALDQLNAALDRLRSSFGLS